MIILYFSMWSVFIRTLLNLSREEEIGFLVSFPESSSGEFQEDEGQSRQGHKALELIFSVNGASHNVLLRLLSV